MQIRKRSLGPSDRPFFTRQDGWLLLELPALLVAASLVPESRWAGFCCRLERLKARLGAFSPDAIIRGMALMNGPRVDPVDGFRVAATRSEHHLQIVREYLWGWSAPLKLVGTEHIGEALRAGRGVVLWVAHFSFNALASKKALSRAGLKVVHLSRPEHGFSKSRFGIAMLNPIRVSAERRYLDDRIIIDRSRPLSAVQQAHRRLAANQIVSITAGAWEGSRVAQIAVKGCALDLAVGAPGLAHLSGAALLPVVTVRDQGTTEVRVVVEAPIPVDRDAERDEAVLQAAQCFADRISPYIDSHPLQWRDWEKIRPASQ